ncbi:MAG: YabP/YqfC family sporulation protein [Oscillospiraceae bacterium]|nr:YabP/YqfC family sporulation protein [Oscillospiraceae bacterium]
MKPLRKRTVQPLSERLAVPMGFVGAESCFSVRGQREVEVHGCQSLLCYEEDLIKLQLYGFVLAVRGAGLTLKTYFGNQIIIRGRIEGLEMEGGVKN